MTKIRLRRRNIEWSRQWLEDGITTAFGYLLKRNAEFGVEGESSIEPEELYAILRQSYSRRQIEWLWRTTIEIH